MTTAVTQTAAQTIEQDMVVGTFDTHDQAEQAVRRLIDAGISANHISIMTQGLQIKEQVQGFVTTGDVARDLAGVGAWTGGLFGLLAGAAFLWVPGLGPLFILGPLASGALGALEGGAVGGLLGAIFGKRMEKDRVPKIQAALQAGKFVVVVHGPPQELETALRVMGENGGQDVATYPAGAAA
jgi:uncharacterized membrane protein